MCFLGGEVVVRYFFREHSATELGSLAASVASPTPLRHFSRKKPMKAPKLGAAGIPTTILETSQELPSCHEGLPSLQNGSCHLADVVVCVDLPNR